MQDNHSIKFSEVLDVKQKPSVRRLGAAKSDHKAIINFSMLCYIIPNRKGRKKINEQVRKYLHNWILQYPRVVHPSI